MQSIQSSPKLDSFGVKRAVQLIVGVLIFGVILFGSAGRLDWIPAWLFLALFGMFSLGMTVWALYRDPALLNERGRAFSKQVPRREKAVVTIITLLQLAMFVVAGLDAGRFGWSRMPLGVQIAGWLLLIPAVIMATWALTSNTFASVNIRIQSERGHRVITEGPYRIVRHPMYLGVVLYGLGVPLALGSWWALIPGGLVAASFFLRAAAEDRTLRAGLPGYEAYMQQTKYRLLPGIW